MRIVLDANLSPKFVPHLTQAGHDVDHVGDLLVSNLPSVAADLERGAVATITRIRIRDLPID